MHDQRMEAKLGQALVVVAGRAALPETVRSGLERVWETSPVGLRVALARREDTSAEILARACSDESVGVRVEAIANPSSPEAAALGALEASEVEEWPGLARRLSGRRLERLAEMICEHPGRRRSDGRPGVGAVEVAEAAHRILDRCWEERALLRPELAAALILRGETLTGETEAGWQLAGKLSTASSGVLGSNLEAACQYLRAGGERHGEAAVEVITRVLGRGVQVEGEVVTLALGWTLQAWGQHRKQLRGGREVAEQHTVLRLTGLAPGLSEAQRSQTVALLSSWDLEDVVHTHERCREAFGIPAPLPPTPVNEALVAVLDRGDAEELEGILEVSARSAKDRAGHEAHAALCEQIASHPRTPARVAARAAGSAWRHSAGRVLGVRKDLAYRVEVVLASPGWVRELGEDAHAVAGAAVLAGWADQERWRRGVSELGRCFLEHCTVAEYASWPWELTLELTACRDEALTAWVSEQLAALETEEWELLTGASPGGGESLPGLIAAIRAAYRD